MAKKCAHIHVPGMNVKENVETSPSTALHGTEQQPWSATLRILRPVEPVENVCTQFVASAYTCTMYR